MKIRLKTRSRLFEVHNSMKTPVLTYNRTTRGVPEVKVKLINEGGVVEYTYCHSGLIGLETFVGELEGLMNKKD